MRVLSTFAPSVTGMSTRDASSKILNAVAERVPWLVGGAADLAPSTKTRLAFEFAGDFQAGGRLGTEISTSGFVSMPCAPPSTA
jgi:transketolase